MSKLCALYRSSATFFGNIIDRLGVVIDNDDDAPVSSRPAIILVDDDAIVPIIGSVAGI